MRRRLARLPARSPRRSACRALCLLTWDIPMTAPCLRRTAAWIVRVLCACRAALWASTSPISSRPSVPATGSAAWTSCVATTCCRACAAACARRRRSARVPACSPSAATPSPSASSSASWATRPTSLRARLRPIPARLRLVPPMPLLHVASRLWAAALPALPVLLSLRAPAWRSPFLIRCSVWAACSCTASRSSVSPRPSLPASSRLWRRSACAWRPTWSPAAPSRLTSCSASAVSTPCSSAWAPAFPRCSACLARTHAA